MDIMFDDALFANNIASQENGGGINIIMDKYKNLPVFRHVFQRTTIEDNRAANVGGGISMTGWGREEPTRDIINDTDVITFIDISVARNVAENGAGIFMKHSNVRPVFKGRIVIRDNTARQNGGGILISDLAMPKILLSTNMTVSGNTALGDGVYDGGGGLYLFRAAFEVAGTSAYKIFQGNTAPHAARKYKNVFYEDGFSIHLTCPPGHEFNAEFEELCRPCGHGRASKGPPDEKNFCIPCESGYFTTSVTNTLCEPCPDAGTLDGNFNWVSQDAPAAATCEDGTLVLLDGWWHTGRLSSKTKFYPCLAPEACTISATSGAHESQAVACSEGYEQGGVLCGVCAEGYARSGLACTRCADTGAVVSLLVLAILAFCAFVSWTIYRAAYYKRVTDPANDPMTLASVRIALSYLQIVSLLGDFDLDWAASTKTLFSVAGGGSGLPTYTAFLDCGLRWSFEARAVFFLALPVACFVVPLAIAPLWFWVIRALWEYRKKMKRRSQFKKKQKSSRGKMNTIQDPHSHSAAAMEEAGVPASEQGGLEQQDVPPRDLYRIAVSVLLFVCYPNVVRQMTHIINCSPEIEGVSYVFSDFAQQCGAGAHGTLRTCAIVVLVLFGVGFPAGCALLLWSQRGRLYAQGQGQEGAERATPYAFIFYGLRPKCFYWASLDMLRKAALVVVTTMLRGDQNGLQVYAGLWIILIALLLHLVASPYVHRFQNRLESVALVGAFCSLLMGQLVALLPHSRGTRVFASGSVFAINLVVGLLLTAFLFKKLRAFLHSHGGALGGRCAGCRTSCFAPVAGVLGSFFFFTRAGGEGGGGPGGGGLQPPGAGRSRCVSCGSPMHGHHHAQDGTVMMSNPMRSAEPTSSPLERMRSCTQVSMN